MTDTSGSPLIHPVARGATRLGLIDTDCHHVGAPAALADLATSIARRIDGPARLGDLYLVALRVAAGAPLPALQPIRQSISDHSPVRTKFRH